MGFVWHIAKREVEPPRERAEEYRREVEEWMEKDTHTLGSVQKIYGKLLHASLVVPSGRERLTELERTLALGHKNPFQPRHPPKPTRRHLQWWLERLSRPSISRSIAVPCELVDAHAYSDARTGFGIGIVIGRQWRAWKLRPGWKTRDGEKDIGWAEAVGFYFLAVALTRYVQRGTHSRLYGDNEGVVDAWRNFRSRNGAVNKVFELLHDHLERDGFVDCIHPVWIPTKDNPADEPSGGIFPPTSGLLPSIQIPSLLTPFIVDTNDGSPGGASRAKTTSSSAWEPVDSSGEEEGEYDTPSVNSELDYLNDAIHTLD